MRGGQERTQEAHGALRRVRRDQTAEQVQAELSEIVAACATERRDRAAFRWRTFCAGYSLRLVLVGVSIQLLQNFSGVLVFVWWSVQIMSFELLIFLFSPDFRVIFRSFRECFE